MNFYSSCVSWPRHDVSANGGLSDMIQEARPITRRTFLKNVDRSELKTIETQMGYEAHPRRGLTMAADWAVSYHRSKLHGRTVYYFRHSAIEYVFA